MKAAPAAAVVRVTAKLTPDDPAEPVTVFYVDGERRKFSRDIARAAAEGFDLGGFCAKTDIEKVRELAKSPEYAASLEWVEK